MRSKKKPVFDQQLIRRIKMLFGADAERAIHLATASLHDNRGQLFPNIATVIKDAAVAGATVERQCGNCDAMAPKCATDRGSIVQWIRHKNHCERK